jgi:hypothetical protein
MNGVKRPLLRYHGGKWILAPWIMGYLPGHRIYTETRDQALTDLGHWVIDTCFLFSCQPETAWQVL